MSQSFAILIASVPKPPDRLNDRDRFVKRYEDEKECYKFHFARRTTERSTGKKSPTSIIETKATSKRDLNLPEIIEAL